MKLCLAIFGVLLLPLTLSGLDPRLESARYDIRSWGLEQGLPQATVHSIARTPDGYLWLGTEEGLARFDGVRFEIYDKKRMKQFKANWVTDLLTDRRGNLWVAVFGGGLLRLKDGEFKVYTTREGLRDDRVWSLCENGDGSLWVGTGKGLNRLKDGVISSYKPPAGAALTDIRCLLEDRDGVLWIGSKSNGLFQGGGAPGHLKKGDRVPRLIKGDCFPRCLLQDTAGHIWIGTYGKGLLRFADGNFQAFGAEEGLDSINISALYEDRNGILWVGTDDKGLYRMKAGRFTAVTWAEELPNSGIRCIYEDPEGSLWVGAADSGLVRLKDSKFIPISKQQGLAGNSVRSIYEDRRGAMWFATGGAGVSKLENGVFTHYTTRDGLSSNNVQTFCEDPEGDMWIGARSGGLNRIRDGKIRIFTTADGLSNDSVRHIVNRRDGGIWVATDAGVDLMENGTFRAFPGRKSVAGAFVMVLYEDGDAGLWMSASGSGLHHLENGKTTTYTTRQGLADNVVLALHKDSGGSLWVGTTSGLSRLKDGVITTVTTEDGLFDDIVYQILEDDDGNFWMSCNNGIFRAARKELEEFCDGRRRTIRCMNYNELDGMISRECIGTTQPAGVRSRDGRLWFPTIRGAVVIDPNNMKTNPVPPPVVIEAITGGKITLHSPFPAITQPPIFTAGTERFEFKYTGLSFLVPERVRFKCILEGVDKDWRDMGGRRTDHYTKLSPGTYTFRVIACNNDGVWNNTGASVSFVLEPFFYQTGWFYMVCALGIVFLAVTISRFLVRQKINRELERSRKFELERLVNERTQALEDKHQKLMEARGRLAQADKMAGLGTLTAGVGHEINNPTNFVHAAAFNLQRDLENFKTFLTELAGEDADREILDAFDEKFAVLFKHLQTMGDGAVRIKEIVKNLRTFSRLEQGEMQPARLTEGLKATYNLVHSKYKDRVEFVLDFRADPEITCYPAELNQVYMNLMVNACQAVIQKQKKTGDTANGTLTMQTLVEGDYAVIRFRDSGIGMSRENQQKMFDPFYTTKAAGEGTGLGLSISYGIIQKHRGRFEVESEEGKGAVISLYLPMNQGSDVNET